MADSVGIAIALVVEKLAKGDGRRETEEAREAEELCRLGGSGSSWMMMAFPPEEKSSTNPICVFVQVTNRHSTWRNYLYEKAEQNKYTNRSGHFIAFMCVSVQKKCLFGLSRQNRYAKEQPRTKKASHRDLYTVEHAALWIGNDRNSRPS